MAIVTLEYLVQPRGMFPGSAVARFDNHHVGSVNVIVGDERDHGAASLVMRRSFNVVSQIGAR